jgi:hypothetical protein
MYVTDRLVFVELHKTGGTHIGKWLARLAPGAQLGKHNRVPDALRSRFVIGSVRNPWDWYVSLWAYGCEGRGTVSRQVTRGLDVPYLYRQLGAEMGRTGVRSLPAMVPAMLRQALHDARKDTAAWRRVYRDSGDAGAFREWLAMLFDPTHRFDMAEGFGFCPVSEWAGLLTYRYLKLFTGLDERLYRDATLGTPEGTRALWEDTRFVRAFVRNERLEDDLLAALEGAGHAVDAAGREALLAARGRRTNASRRAPAAHYHDDRTIALVAAREALVIANHGYEPPSPHRQAE